MDDELPGFKVNYNGGGKDEEMERSSESRLEGVDGATENGPVTRGEADSKPVMVEKASVGGLEEKGSETASEGVVGGSEKGGDGLGQITEAEARAMLIEDNARAKEELKNANSRGKKVLVVVLVLAAVLVVAGIGVSMILGGMGKDGAGNGDKQEGNNGGNAAVVEKPGEDDAPEEAEVVELSLDNELVQKVYGNFQGIPRLFDGWWGFYVNDDVRSGKVVREGMLLLAGANYPASACSGDYEYVGMGGKVEECVSGEEIRQKVKEMFGQDLEFTENDRLGAFCGGKQYDIANDEFYQTGIGCGGTSSSSLVRVLNGAERKGDELYLYEKVLLFDALEYYHVGEVDKKVWDEWNEYWGSSEGIFGEKIGEYEVPSFDGSGDYNTWLEENKQNLTSEYGDLFKWTFKKNEAGDYVFTGLERVR